MATSGLNIVQTHGDPIPQARNLLFPFKAVGRFQDHRSHQSCFPQELSAPRDTISLSSSAHRARYGIQRRKEATNYGKLPR